MLKYYSGVKNRGKWKMGGESIIFEIHIVHYDRFMIVIDWKHKDKYDIKIRI